MVIGAQILQAAGALGYLAANGAAAVCVAAVLLAAGQQSFYSALFALIADVSPPGPKDRSFAQVNMIRSGANALSEAAAPAASRGRYLAAFQFSFTIPGQMTVHASPAERPSTVPNVELAGPNCGTRRV